jgi:hypothetical protein
VLGVLSLAGEVISACGVHCLGTAMDVGSWNVTSCHATLEPCCRSLTWVQPPLPHARPHLQFLSSELYTSLFQSGVNNCKRRIFVAANTAASTMLLVQRHSCHPPRMAIDGDLLRRIEPSTTSAFSTADNVNRHESFTNFDISSPTVLASRLRLPVKNDPI